MTEIKVEKPDKETLEKLGIESWSPWSCEVSRFEWEYDSNETCYLFEGKVTVETESGTVEIKDGDLVTFPKGLKCVWDVKEPVRKVFMFF